MTIFWKKLIYYSRININNCQKYFRKFKIKYLNFRGLFYQQQFCLENVITYDCAFHSLCILQTRTLFSLTKNYILNSFNCRLSSWVHHFDCSLVFLWCQFNLSVKWVWYCLLLFYPHSLILILLRHEFPFAVMSQCTKQSLQVWCDILMSVLICSFKSDVLDILRIKNNDSLSNKADNQVIFWINLP